MKPRTIFSAGGVAVAAVLMFAIVGSALAQTQPGFGPGGMMGGRGSVGQGYAPGMMGGGYSRGMMGGPGMMGGWSRMSAQAQPVNSLDDARQAFQRYIDVTGNKNFVLDDVMEFQWNYYAIVKDTSTGEGAFELLANPQTGAVFPEMGPNMMWNTEYGHMAGVGMMGSYSARPGVQPTVSPDQAQQIAQERLDQNQAGSSTEAPDSFPGYYTLHITRDGAVTGMLSVNAYTGQVWCHTWHGAFVPAA
jgi:hypothetical protein